MLLLVAANLDRQQATDRFERVQRLEVFDLKIAGLHAQLDVLTLQTEIQVDLSGSDRKSVV